MRIWLDRIHAGENEGKGRRQWNADQKARNSGYDKNNLALQILDIAEKQGIITAEERKGRLSTVQRYLGNPVMRDTLGLNEPSAEQASTDVAEKDFNIMLTKFVSDVAQKKITTRVDSDGIKKYSRTLSKAKGVSGARGTRRDLTKTIGVKKARPQKPTEPERPEKIEPNRKLEQSLKSIPSYKLQRLYFSLCDIPLENHTPLLAVGAWAFLETLTALNGRKTNDPFSNFLNADRLAKMGFGDKKKTKGIRTVVQRISDMGNVTKHDEKSTYLNQEQLANDFETLSSLLVALSDGAKGKT